MQRSGGWAGRACLVSRLGSDDTAGMQRLYESCMDAVGQNTGFNQPPEPVNVGVVEQLQKVRRTKKALYFSIQGL